MFADKSKKARPCCSCAASDGQTEATEGQRVPAGEAISMYNTDLFDTKGAVIGPHMQA